MKKALSVFFPGKCLDIFFKNNLCELFFGRQTETETQKYVSLLDALLLGAWMSQQSLRFVSFISAINEQIVLQLMKLRTALCHKV